MHLRRLFIGGLCLAGLSAYSLALAQSDGPLGTIWFLAGQLVSIDQGEGATRGMSALESSALEPRVAHRLYDA